LAAEADAAAALHTSVGVPERKRPEQHGEPNGSAAVVARREWKSSVHDD
jgi:hypothetical protein